MATNTLSPAAMATACDVSVDTLRYYEKEGLIDPVERTAGGQRQYTADDVAWVQVLRCLRATAMPIKEMREFAELVREGDSAIPERVELLTTHRAKILAQMQVLEDALATVDHKIDAYSQTLSGTPAVDTDTAIQSPTLNGKGARAHS